jgi:two-component system cell cycle sensor histidine kinase/response regulator CckA
VAASVTYARATRVVAVVIILVALGKQLTSAPPDPVLRQDLLILRMSAAILALAAGLLSSPHRPVGQLRLLALLLGFDGVFSSLGTMTLIPSEAWEQAVSLIALVLGAAVFMPWSWRWQSAFTAITIVATSVTVLAVVPRSALDGKSDARLLLMLCATSAASIAGAYLADRARARIVASEARYRSLFESAGDAIAVLDATGVIREANPHLAELLARPVGEVLGRPLSDFYAPGSRGNDPRTALTSITSSHAIALTGVLGRASVQLLRADGRPIDVNISLARFGADGAGAVQAIVHDLTEQRTRERRAIQEQRLDSMARLAGGLAHQFNNILGGILTHAAILREEVTQPDGRAAADEVLEGARRGRELTQELLNFTRHSTVAPKPALPGQIIESLAALARATLPADIKVATEVPAGLPAVLADVDHVVHTALQLVLNARDAMRGRGGGVLTLGAAEVNVTGPDPRWPNAAPGRYVRLFIRDTGIGMDASTLERVLEPFFSTKPLHEATGLGLTGAHAIMVAHKGALGIESTPGRGTTVHLLVPATDAPLASAGAIAPPPPPAPAGATILIVDDEAIVRSSLRRALTRMNYRVLEAEDGPAAMAALQSAQPAVDLVILDLVLPGGGAAIFELLTAVRPGLRVLVSSGFSPDTAAAQGLTVRASGFLPKPYEMSELRDAVAKALAS